MGNYHERKRREAAYAELAALRADVTDTEDAIAEVGQLASDNEISIEDLATAFVEYVEYNEGKE